MQSTNVLARRLFSVIYTLKGISPPTICISRVPWAQKGWEL